jgi:hypothetical protein
MTEPSKGVAGAYSVISPGAKVRYAANFELNADMARITLRSTPQRLLFSRSGVDGRARRNTGREQVLHRLIGYYGDSAHYGDSALIQSDRRPLA